MFENQVLSFGGRRSTMVECPVCLRDFELSETAREGDLVQCPHCKIWFKLVLEHGEWTLVKV
jgi:DNA-directed RNA polymerase subunit RPC12/RpoP